MKTHPITTLATSLVLAFAAIAPLDLEARNFDNQNLNANQNRQVQNGNGVRRNNNAQQRNRAQQARQNARIQNQRQQAAQRNALLNSQRQQAQQPIVSDVMPVAVELAPLERKIFDRINLVRAQRGLAPVTLSGEAVGLARQDSNALVLASPGTSVQISGSSIQFNANCPYWAGNVDAIATSLGDSFTGASSSALSGNLKQIGIGVVVSDSGRSCVSLVCYFQ